MRTAPISAVLRLSIGMVLGILFSAYFRGGQDAKKRHFARILDEVARGFALYERGKGNFSYPHNRVKMAYAKNANTSHTSTKQNTPRRVFAAPMVKRSSLQRVTRHRRHCHAASGRLFCTLYLSNRQPATFSLTKSHRNYPKIASPQMATGVGERKRGMGGRVPMIR